MTDHKKVYQQEGNQYQRLISREDYQENLLPAILDIIPVDNLYVVDLGAGTGRLSNLLVPLVKGIYAFDLSPHMLGVASDQLYEGGLRNWLAAAADHRHLPLPENTVDLVVSGWSLCYLVVWEYDQWKSELEKGLAEIDRILSYSGKTIIIESLGTGTETPEPLPKLSGYIDYLNEAGFLHKWIRTDYCFKDLHEARELTKFFFGEDMLDKIQYHESPILPECTGLWWK